MIDVTIRVPVLDFNALAVDLEAMTLADNIERTLVNETKLALVAHGKIATGKTLRSIKGITVEHRTMTASNRAGLPMNGLIHKRITGEHGLKFIISGRRAGAPMPVQPAGIAATSGRGSRWRGRFTGRFVAEKSVFDTRGKRIFVPFPAMEEWFNALNIPRERWWLIMRAIKRRGIPSVGVWGEAYDKARPAIHNHIQRALANMSRSIVTVRRYGTEF